MNKEIHIINGPNINMLGTRETQFYGEETWTEIETRIRKLGDGLGLVINTFQSNHEGEIVDYIQQKTSSASGIVINPAGYSKTGYSILDALLIYNIPYIEVHLSNIYSRGGWHSESIFTKNAIGLICGLKGYVYDLALKAIIFQINNQ